MCKKAAVFLRRLFLLWSAMIISILIKPPKENADLTGLRDCKGAFEFRSSLIYQSSITYLEELC